MPRESAKPKGERRSPIPGWDKGFGVAGLVVLALIAAMLVTGHGPGQHFGANADNRH